MNLNNGFEISKWIDTSIIDEDYQLHTHRDRHEILLFLDGDTEFHVEGSVYPMSPCDLVIAPTNELHRLVHRSSHRYERYIIYIDTDFFVKHNCVRFAGVFENKLPGVGNFFGAEFVRRTGIVEIFQKMLAYFEEGETLVAMGLLFELLYHLNRETPVCEQGDRESAYVRNAVAYINDNLTSDFTVRKLADALFVSSEYLSRLFRKQMKISVKQYITYKRLLCARELYKSGKNLLNASIEAGFTNYSNFYRMYVKEFRQPPSTMKKQAQGKD